MIEINLTLIIQAVHFCIAYILIRLFILKPVLAVIHTKEHFHNDLVSLLNKRKAQVATKEQEKKLQWKQCQRYFAQHTPDLTNPALNLFKLSTSTIEQPILNKTVVQEQTKTLENALVESWRAHGI